MKTMKIEEGKTYLLRHSRLGSAMVKVISCKLHDPEFVKIEVVDGELNGMSDDWLVGDVRDVRLSFCEFIEITK